MSFQDHFSSQPGRHTPKLPDFPPAALSTLIPDAPRSLRTHATPEPDREVGEPTEVYEPFETVSTSSEEQKEEPDVEKQHKDLNPIGGDAQLTQNEQEAKAEGQLPQIEKPTLGRTTTKASVNNVSAIPNGGLRAWLQVLGAWSLFFNTWGIINTFGTYQTFFEAGTVFTASSSAISWIGAVQAFLLMLVGALTGPIYDAGHFRKLLFVGSFLVVLGQMMLSICHTYWQVFLAQAVCIGVGAGCLFVPSVAIMSTYFSTRIALAVGLSASGSSIGGVIYPVVFHKLQPTLGFPWATRIIGFIALATLMIPITVMKVRVLPAAKRKLIDIKAFTELPYLFYCLGGLIGFAGLYVPFFYIQYFAISTRITNVNFGFYTLSILNAASVFGRILPNMIADRFGGLNILIPCAAMTSILIYCLLVAVDVPGIVLIAIFYGFFSGTFVSLPPSIFVSLSPNRGMVGTRMGMGFGTVSIGVLVGTPIAGAILGEDNFRGIWIFGGTLTLAATVLFVAARVAKVGWGLKVKA